MKNAFTSFLPEVFKNSHSAFFYLLFRLSWRHSLIGLKATGLLAVIFLTLLTSCDTDEVEDLPPPGNGLVTAQAGPDFTVPVNQDTLLDASASKDNQDKPLNFSWVLKVKPQGSAAILVNPNQAKPGFKADLPGEYEAEVTVSSPNGQSKDQVKITATALPPTGTSPTILSENITTDLMLPDKFTEHGKADYLVTNPLLVTAKLTVAPGVVIEFEKDQGLEISIQGSLIANGTAAQPITFTGKQKEKGFWKNIFVQGNIELAHTEVTYGGSDNSANVVLDTESWSSVGLKVTNSIFSNSGGYGLYLGTGTSIFEFSDNSFRNNAKSSLFAHATVLPALNVSSQLVGGNGHEGIATGGEMPHYSNSQEVTWPALPEGTTYRVVDDIIIETDVKVAPGVIMEFAADKGLYVRNGQSSAGYGSLVAQGTAAKPITFTGQVKQKGYWKGIMIASSRQVNTLDYVRVSYGGSSNFYNFDGSIKTNVGVYGKIDAQSGYGNPFLKISNSEFTHSGGYGLYVAGEAATIPGYAQNKFNNNTGAAIYLPANQIHHLDHNSRYQGSNGFNGIETQGIIAHYQEVVWPTAIGGLGVHVVGDLILNSGVRILSDPKGPIAFLFDANKGLRVQNTGYLVAKGSSAAVVSFRSYPHAPTPANWQGIVFESTNPLNELSHVFVANGGTWVPSPSPVSPTANVTVLGSAKIINCAIFNSLGYGIYVTRQGTINPDAATGNTYQDNKKGNFYQEK